MKKSVLGIIIVNLLVFVTIIFGRPSYIGYSGAPGSNGYCASSCHGSSGGTIQIDGFPDEYVSEQTYAITISHSYGNSIRQFNGSCRIGDGSHNAGVISAGDNTQIYSTQNETNGIRFLPSNQHSGTFSWTAPSEGTGEVRLYIAGQQGGFGGNNSIIELTATEQTTEIEDELSAIPNQYLLFQNYPNPFNVKTTISFDLREQIFVALKIYDLLGREVQTLINEDKQAGLHNVAFDASELSSGIYFYRLQAGDYSETKRMVLLK